MNGKIPRVFILEGKDATNLHLKNGEGEIAKTILRGGGWRWYQIITDGKSGVVMSRKMDEWQAREKFHAKFYPRGSWEDETHPTPDEVMPVPRAEIFEEIFGRPVHEKQQMEFA